MSRYRLQVARDVQHDLDTIAEQIAEDGGMALARRWSARLRQTALTLAEFPYKGVSLPDLENRRRLVVSPYLIIYTLIEPEQIVVVLRILDGRRNIPAVLRATPNEEVE